MGRILIVLSGLGAMAGAPLLAQPVTPTDAATPAEVTATRNVVIPNLDRLAAPQAVREGNRRLLEGDSATALAAYDRAKSLRPDAPEIPFVEGLAYFAQKQYDQARDAFKKTAASDNAPLADDALYSIGTTYHAEAFENLQDPQSAIEKLESAMQRYREVLASRPDHEAARDANFKAASMRRQLKQMLEQQEQQQQEQQQDQQCDQENTEQQDQQDQQASETEESQEEQASQPQASEGDEEQQEQQETSPQQQEEQVSREQAERQLREMMQAMREREKMRRIEVQKIPVAPVDKDW